MFSRILVAVDGSHNAGAALIEALAIVEDQTAQLRIVHVIDRAPRSFGLILPDLETFADAALESGRRVLAEAEGVARDAGVVAEGVLAEIGRCPCPRSSKVLREAEDWPADLIVIGAPAYSGLRHHFAESLTGDVVRLAHVPVLVAHEAARAGRAPLTAGARA